MKNFSVKNIVWDTSSSSEEDDMDISNLNLPSECFIMAEDEDAIADALSDTFGFCVTSFNIAHEQ